MISPIYLAELSPSKYRGRTTAMYSICCVGGQSVVLLTNFFINKSMTPDAMTEIGWRYILSSALIPCAAFMVCVFFIPESPRWSVFKGRDKEALATLGKVSNAEHAQVVYKEIKESFAAINQCQKKRKLRLDRKTVPLLIIGIGLAVGNQISGINVIQYFGPTLLQNVLGNVDSTLFQTFLLSIFQFTGVVIGMMLLDKVGRRKLLLMGALASTIFLAYSFAAFYYRFPGVLAVVGLFGYMLFFGITWGQIVWTVIGEIFPTEIRTVGVGISICAMSFANFIISTSFPIINSNAYLQQVFHGGFPLLLFSVCSVLMFFFTLRYVPETAGITLEKVQDVALRKFYGHEYQEQEQEQEQEEVFDTQMLNDLSDGIK